MNIVRNSKELVQSQKEYKKQRAETKSWGVLKERDEFIEIVEKQVRNLAMYNEVVIEKDFYVSTMKEVKDAVNSVITELKNNGYYVTYNSVSNEGFTFARIEVHMRISTEKPNPVLNFLRNLFC